MTTTTYTITCLSPVHIGTGTQFSKLDGAYSDGRWWLVDLDKVLARGADASKLAEAMSRSDFAWEVWLREKGIAPSEVAAYGLFCSEAPENGFIREAIKDVFQRPYLPGTSIKGAVRTAVLWSLMQDESRMNLAMRCLKLAEQVNRILQVLQDLTRGDERRSQDTKLHRQVLQAVLSLTPGEIDGYQRALYFAVGRDPDLVLSQDYKRQQRVSARDIARLRRRANDSRYADDVIERALLGYDPNHDLMRAVQVRDSLPSDKERLAVGTVWTHALVDGQLVKKQEEGEYRSFVEWLVPQTPLQVEIHIDEFLFTQAANRQLRFNGEKESTVRQLARTCNDCMWAATLAEKVFYEERGLNTVCDFYSGLQRSLEGLPEGAFLLNVGWGSGWKLKTVGELLHKEAPDDFTRLRQRYRLGEPPKTRQTDSNDLFPNTRRIAYSNHAPLWPMGWVILSPTQSD